MFGHVDGSMATAARSRRTGRAGARRNACTVGHATLSETTEKVRRKYRKYRKCRKPPAAIRRARLINDYRALRCIRRRPVCAGWAGGNRRKLAETPCREFAREAVRISTVSLSGATPRPDWRSACGNCGNSLRSVWTAPRGWDSKTPDRWLIIGHAYEVAGQAGDWAWAARSRPFAQRRPRPAPGRLDATPRTRPVVDSPRSRATSLAATSSSKAGFARKRNRSPASVRPTLRVVRMNSTAPMRAASARIA
jgi:hypothetical protein